MGKDRIHLNDLVGEKFELADAIDYQTGSIVSRTLIDKKAATLTVFALDEGQSISEHTAPHTAILQVIDGTAIVTIDERDHELNAEEAIVLPPDVPHAVDAPSKFKMLLTMVR